MFTIEMLPAAHGDCLWIEYGSVRNRRRILIDVGVAGTDRALRQRIADAGESCEIELFVVSHCDADHIEGAIGLLKRPPRGVTFKDVWFNGWRHLPAGPRRRLGGVQGEMLSTLLCDLGLPWNRAFAGAAAAITDELPSCTLADGMKLTLLSPTLEQLRRLRPKWQQECAKKSVVPGSVESGREALERYGRRLGEAPKVESLSQTAFKADTSVANGSSIAFLAEFDGKTVLFGGDAFPHVLEASLQRLNGASSRLTLDACKVPHHGSKANTSPELLKRFRSRRYLVSTSGAVFHHPDPEAIARILVAQDRPTALHFNYRSARTTPWENPECMRQYDYEAVYAKGSDGLKVTL